MNHITKQEKIELLKNILADPDDWVSREILRLSDELEQEQKLANAPPESNKQ